MLHAADRARQRCGHGREDGFVGRGESPGGLGPDEVAHEKGSPASVAQVQQYSRAVTPPVGQRSKGQSCGGVRGVLEEALGVGVLIGGDAIAGLASDVGGEFWRWTRRRRMRPRVT